MKTNHTHHPVCRTAKCRPFPNAAESRYYRGRILDYALAAATSLGTVTILLFFITMV